MSRKDKAFWEVQEDWSRRKHLILHYYLKPAAAKLGSISKDRSVVIVDGFAGRGTYEDGSPGSPIHLCQLADECAKWTDPLFLEVHHVEPLQANFKELCNSVAPWDGDIILKNHQDTFAACLPSILATSVRKPLFAFLDPFRPKHLAFSDFVPLLTRSDPTELLIVFHTPGVKRMVDSVRPTALTAPGIKQQTEGVLDALYGGDTWRSLLREDKTDEEDVIKCFIDQLLTKNPHRYICWHSIYERHERNLKYHIVFVTRHPQGVLLMNDAFLKEQQDVYRADIPSDQGLLDFEELKPQIGQDGPRRIALLTPTYLQIGAEVPDRVWQRPELMFEAISRTFGEFSETEHRRTVQALLDSPIRPRIRVLDKKPLSTGKWRINDMDRLQFDL